VRTVPALLLIALALGCGRAPEPSGSPPRLRVRLACITERESVEVRIEGPWVLYDADTGEERERGEGLGRRIAVRGGRLSRPLRLVAEEGRIRVDERRYRGEILIRAGATGAELILDTDLEDYLPGVLAGEMGRRFHPAALRAQAVMARTYALHRLRQRDDEGAWHVTDDTRDQVFVGETDVPDLRDAVASTKGMTLTYGTDPVPGYFHSTCGGHTASAAEVFGEADLPPLVGVPCGYCADSPRFRWSPPLRFPLEEVVRELSLPGPPTAVEILASGRDGRLRTVRFLCPEPVDFTGESLRFHLGPERLRSTRVHRLSIADGHLVAEGGGAGHGVGLCQWGAEGMARAGASAADILAYYCPGAALVRIY